MLQDDDDAAAKREAERKRLEAEAAKEQESIDTIMTSGRLFVRNLPFGASEDELSEYFRRWGSVSQVSADVLVSTTASGRTTGMTYLV